MSSSFKGFRGLCGLALAAAIALSTTGCSTPVVSSTPTPVAFKACMVSSREGFDDSGVNAAAYFGLLQSEAQYGPRTSVVQVSANAGIDEFSGAISKLIDRNCNLVFGVGQQLVAPIRMAATGHPSVNFALVDAVLTDSKGSELQLNNVQNLEFDATQAAFLAGYLAASQSNGSPVGVVAGAKSQANFKQVWAFQQGVRYFDAKHFKNTVVIGAMGENISSWNFAGNNPTTQSLTSRISGMIDAGASVIYPVGLPGHLVANLVAAHSGELVIGSDSDWWAQPGFAQVKSVVLASMVKKVSESVVSAVGKAVAGNFVGGTGGNWLGTLETGDVALTVQHDIAYGAGVQGELDAIKTDLVNGRILIPALPTGLVNATS